MHPLWDDQAVFDAAARAGVRIVPREAYQDLQSQSQIALELIEVCAAHVASDPDLLARALGHHGLAKVLLANAHHEREPMGRFDCLFDRQGRPQFIEYNAGVCGGAFDTVEIARRFLYADEGREIAADRGLEAAPTDELFVDSVRQGCLAATGVGRQNLGYILPPGMAVPAGSVSELQAFSALYAARGGEVRTVSFSDIEVGADGLSASGWPLHAAIIAEWTALLALGPLNHPLFTQDVIGHSWIVGNLRAAVFRGGKHLFAVMSDPALGARLTPAQRRWVDDHVPMTRLIPGPDAPRAEAQDVLEWAAGRREHLLLKPSLGKGGGGIVAGWTVDAEQWREHLRQARMTPYIVQERVHMRPEPDLPDGAMADLCAYVWFDGPSPSVAGLLSRSSKTWLLNVAGGAHPLAVLISQ